MELDVGQRFERKFDKCQNHFFDDNKAHLVKCPVYWKCDQVGFHIRTFISWGAYVCKKCNGQLFSIGTDKGHIAWITENDRKCGRVQIIKDVTDKINEGTYRFFDKDCCPCLEYLI